MTANPLPRLRPVSELASYLLVCAMMWTQFALLLTSAPHVAQGAAAAAPAAASSADVSKLPLTFVPNAGQTDPQVRFQAQAMGGTIFFTPGEVVLALPKSQTDAHDSATIRVQFEGANADARITGEQQLPGVVNHMVGADASRWHTGLPTYGSLVYQSLYAGVDLRYEDAHGSLKSTYVVAPGANPARLRWRYNGAEAVGIDRASGNLHVALSDAAAPIVEQAPVAWQEIGGARVPVAARYAITDDGSVTFALGSYNPAYALTIDPVMSYTTYLGGAGFDTAYDVVVDSNNNVYVVGSTDSAPFPGGSGPMQGGSDVFVVKLDAAGAVQYTTILGGTAADEGRSIAVDAGGNAYVTGYTYSASFSGTATTNVGSADVFVTKLDSAGASPASVLLGSDAEDVGNGIAVDGSTVYVTGYTNVPAAQSFPVTNGSTEKGGYDAFYARLSMSLAPTFVTYLGGTANDEGRDITVSNGVAYIVGRAGPNFPLSGTVAKSTFGGGNSDVFIAQFNAADAVVASTYLGGSNDDEGYGIAVDGSGDVYVTGYTLSTNMFSAPSFQTSNAGLSDAFVARLNAAGTAFDYGTYLGGSGGDTAYDIALASNDVVVVGSTTSDNFPKLAPQTRQGQDAFVTRLNTTTSTLVYSTYLGGSGTETARAVGLQNDGVAVVAGQTSSTSGMATGNAMQAAYGGGVADAFVSKVTLPTVAFTNPAINHNENDSTTVKAVVQLSTPSNQDVTVPVSLDAASTATAGTDYTITPTLPATLTIPAGQTSATVTITVTNDVFPEPNETIVLALGAPSNAMLGTASTSTITIVDDDSPPDVSVNDVSVVEGNAGSTNAVFTVSLSKAFVYNISVDYATADGTATAGSDYTSTAGTIVLPAGTITQTISVPVTPDTTYEADETFFLNLSNARYTGNTTQPTITDAQGSGTIGNDDTAPTMSLTGPAPVVEGNSGTTNANFTVSLSAAAGLTVTVNYATADGTATAGADYAAQTGTLTFAPGETSKIIAVPVNGDTTDENDETFSLKLSAIAPATVVLTGPDQAGATITDDDAAPTAAINDVTVTEGNSGATNASFTVTLSAASGKVITMTATTADGTAVVGKDYTATTAALVFQPGETSKTVNVPVLGDTIDEADETFVVNLTNPVNVTFADAQGQGTITDDDAAPTLAISDVTVTEGNSGTTNATFNVTMSAASEQTVTVDFATQDNSATAGSDYVAATGKLTFATGETTKTVTIAVNGDTTDEADEQFFVNLANPVNATIADAQAVGTIMDDDGPVLRVSNASVTEGNSGTATIIFTATLSAASPQDITVNYATQDGSATAGADYVAASGTLAFAAGETSKQIMVTVNGDRVVESDEDFTLNLSNIVQATLAANAATGTIVNDDHAPVAGDDTFATDEDTALTVDAAQGILSNDSDADTDDVLTLVMIDQPASGTLTMQPDGSFTYTPAPNFYGTVTFTYKLHDIGGNESNIATGTITVRSVNDPATASDDFAYVGKDVATRINVTANDSPGPDPEDSLTITAITFTPANGTVAITNGGTDVTYTPNPGYVGGDTFVYRVCDNDTPQYCATARVNVSVGQFRVFMPMIDKIPLPDLVGSLSVSPAQVSQYQHVVFTAKVTNQGTAPASNFWVDMYVNPMRVPRVNEPWNEICNPRACYGVAWFVTRTLQPGESIQLTTTPDSYVAENTAWLDFFTRGEQRFYLYVDSWNRNSSNTQKSDNAAVTESDETNNLSELDLIVTASSTNEAPAQMPDLPSITDLAPRSLEPRSQQ
ncbi:MAG TPA: Calx-beta domain-containing protein [Roseiflexaceae bacterium]|nr:Calx-beta domain-containing protein [Roseiflexaceae bacterium]